jgi:hypothetical protein
MCICIFAFSGDLGAKKNTKKSQKTPSEKKNLKCSFAHLRICFRGKGITIQMAQVKMA